MGREEHVEQVRTANYLSVLTGLWLVVAPGLIGYGNTGLKWSSVITGAVIALLGVAQELRLEYVWPDWVMMLAGLWAIAAPYVFSGSTTGAKWAGWVGGVLAIVFGAWGYAASAEDPALRHA